MPLNRASLHGSRPWSPGTGAGHAELYPGASNRGSGAASKARGKKQKTEVESRNGERSTGEFFTASKQFLLVPVVLLAETSYNLCFTKEVSPSTSVRCSHSVPTPAHFISVALTKGFSPREDVGEPLAAVTVGFSSCGGISRGHDASAGLCMHVSGCTHQRPSHRTALGNSGSTGLRERCCDGTRLLCAGSVWCQARSAAGVFWCATCQCWPVQPQGGGTALLMVPSQLA